MGKGDPNANQAVDLISTGLIFRLRINSVVGTILPSLQVRLPLFIVL